MKALLKTKIRSYKSRIKELKIAKKGVGMFGLCQINTEIATLSEVVVDLENLLKKGG